MHDVALLIKYTQSLSVLYVEDENELNESVSKYLNKLFKRVESAYNGEEGLEKYKLGEFDIVITDINMPKINGIEMAEEIKEINPKQEVIIISAHTQTDYFLDAIRLGISDYILKPIIYEQMNDVLYKKSRAIQMRKENDGFHENLKRLVEEQTQSIKENYELTINAMIDLVESRDTYTGGHSQRVASYSKAIAQEMKLSEEECELIFRAGMLHDVGKVTTPDAILLKPGQLSAREYALIQNHVTVSYNLLSKIPMYAKLAEVVILHHERYDGNGYPNGLKGDEISVLGKIMIIADSFDAMTTSRIYKGRMTNEEAMVEIQDKSGAQFDPEIVPFARKALSRVVINQNITQLPINSIENERFAYFFNDLVTDTYNQGYLNLFLQSLPDDDRYNACVYFLRNFSQYNKKFGWEKGNVLLKSFAEYVSKKHPDSLLFRVHGDDFVRITKERIDEERLQPPFLEGAGIYVESHSLVVEDDLMDKIRAKEYDPFHRV